MSRFKSLCIALSVLAAGALPAMASVTVNTPSNGAQVTPQFTLKAVASSCSGQAVSAMGFSLDSSSDTTVINGTTVNATVTATSGAHTLHVKAWGRGGASCVSDVAIKVGGQAGASNGVSVSAPGDNANVSTSFVLTADATTCSSQAVSAMGYSFDSGNTTIVHATSINTNVTGPSGSHTLHVKAWGNQGAACMTNVPLNISAGGSSAPPPDTSTSNPTQAEGISVSEPANNSTVPSPFVLGAAASNCSSEPVAAMGYSLDNSSNTAIVKSTSVAASVSASAGSHVLHVKAWGPNGASCVANVAITVANTGSNPPPTSSGSNLTVSSPSSGASVSTPFQFTANATSCSSQSVTSVGYSIDYGSSTIDSGHSFNTQITAPSGTHTLHFKAWGSGGAVCTSDVVINVGGTSTGSGAGVPSNAVNVSSIQSLGNWVAAHDPAAGTSSSGSTYLVSSPSMSGNARRFNTSFSGSSGEIYHVTFGDDTSATHFMYDAWVYLTSSASNVANMEMDMNQVMSNGQTVIYGFQCDGWSGTWDYTENAGSPSKPVDRWLHSSQKCNVSNWSKNAWHHVQISYSRNNSGYVTYHSVWLDGVEQPINATVPSSFALGWGPVLITNFQIDGKGNGSNTVYLDKLTVSRW